MMPRHAAIVCSFPLAVRDFLLWYFRTRRPRGRELDTVPLAEVGASQADVVLALLRNDFLDEVERLVGKRIVHCPASLRLPAAQMEFADPTVEERRVFRRIAPNPRLPTTPAWHRYRVIREGMTYQQALIRGVKRRDVRLGLRRGWFQLEFPM